MRCQCPVCHGKDINKAGIELAEKEVIPFFKTELLKLQYPNHPFPRKYEGLLASVFCFAQALAFDRAHSYIGKKYYTENKWMLQHSESLQKRFGMPIFHVSELKTEAQRVCEFNVEIR